MDGSSCFQAKKMQDYYTERDVNFGPWEDGEVFMNVFVSQLFDVNLQLHRSCTSVEVLCLS